MPDFQDASTAFATATNGSAESLLPVELITHDHYGAGTRSGLSCLLFWGETGEEQMSRSSRDQP